MKKFLSLLLSLVMLVSVTAGVDLSAYADDVNSTTISTNGTWYEGYITNTNSVEWYKFTIPSDGSVTIKVMRYLGYMYFDLYNADLSNRILGETYYGGADSSSPQTNTYNVDLSKGTYCIKISKYNSNTGKHKVCSTFKSFATNEKEPNDFENAMKLSLSTNVMGSLTYQDSVDWYEFTLSSASKVNITLTRYLGYMYFDLYNSDLSNRILGETYYGGADSSSPQTNTYNADLSKGTYYIKISKYSNSTGKYKLSWNMNVNVSKPSNFKVSTRSTTGLKLSWKKASGVNGYQLQQYKGGKWTTIATTSANSYTVKKLKSGTSYKFRVRSYKTVSGTKYYSGWVNLTTPTKPATVSFSSLKAGKKKFTAKWKKTTCTGYQIQYSTSSKFKGAKTVTVSKNSTVSKTVSKLKAKKKYYVRVRAYKTVNGTKYYGAWSKTKSVKTK